MKISLLCGGPSLERGISLNSARSVLDHLADSSIEILPIYFNQKKEAFNLSKAQLYSNTPSDFDFKLSQQGKKLTTNQLVKFLKKTDLVFPTIHGQFGEDGVLQSFLAKHHIPFVGSSAAACKKCFDKGKANQFINSNGFFTLPFAVLKIYQQDHQEIIEKFFKTHSLKKAIIKPATSGSSISVFSVNNSQEALEKAKVIFSKRIDTRVILEPFCEGIEFTVIILQNKFNLPVSILPTEIETDYQKNQIFDFRKKYLPTRQVKYHCPPRFSQENIEKIQLLAEQIFQLFHMSDFARFDGWLLPDGKIWFSDFNPISGMEQNSFLFQQASRIGMSHSEVLNFIVKNACRRQGITTNDNSKIKPVTTNNQKKPVHVLFGGNTSERQVSLMSGTNVWLKLKKSKQYASKPFLLDLEGNVWLLPYALTLNHTVEEIYENCINAKNDQKKLKFLEEKALLKLALLPDEAKEEFFIPQKISLQKFINLSKDKFVFIALHGGIGENGTLQKMLTKKGIKFNGPGSEASLICMDKYKTSQKIKDLAKEGILTAQKISLKTKELMQFKKQDFEKLFKQTLKQFFCKTLIIKPQDDGCSSGIVRLFNAKDLQKYIHCLQNKIYSVPINTFKNQIGIIEMPLEIPSKLILEEFIETDIIRIKANKLHWTKRSGWIEITVGFFTDKDKSIKVLSPSLTVAEGEVLSVEEKFQGGTGVNITPPPKIKPAILKKIKQSIKKVVKKLGLSGYSRLDAFCHYQSGKIIIIEVNTLPALTPSTVIFQQALSEKTPLYPREFLEGLIEN